MKNYLFIAVLFILLAPVSFVGATNVYVGVKIDSALHADGVTPFCLPNSTSVSIMNGNSTLYTYTNSTKNYICAGQTIWMANTVNLQTGHTYTAKLNAPGCYAPYIFNKPHCKDGILSPCPTGVAIVYGSPPTCKDGSTFCKGDTIVYSDNVDNYPHCGSAGVDPCKNSDAGPAYSAPPSCGDSSDFCPDDKIVWNNSYDTTPHCYTATVKRCPDGVAINYSTPPACADGVTRFCGTGKITLDGANSAAACKLNGEYPCSTSSYEDQEPSKNFYSKLPNGGAIMDSGTCWVMGDKKGTCTQACGTAGLLTTSSCCAWDQKCQMVGYLLNPIYPTNYSQCNIDKGYFPYYRPSYGYYDGGGSCGTDVKVTPAVACKSTSDCAESQICECSGSASHPQAKYHTCASGALSCNASSCVSMYCYAVKNHCDTTTGTGIYGYGYNLCPCDYQNNTSSVPFTY